MAGFLFLQLVEGAVELVALLFDNLEIKLRTVLTLMPHQSLYGFYTFPVLHQVKAKRVS